MGCVGGAGGFAALHPKTTPSSFFFKKNNFPFCRTLLCRVSLYRREVLSGLWWGGGHEEGRVSIARQWGRGFGQHHAGFWRSTGGGDPSAHSQRTRGSCTGEAHCRVHRGARWVTTWGKFVRLTKKVSAQTWWLKVWPHTDLWTFGCCDPCRSDTRGTGTWRRLLGEFFKFGLRASFKLRLKCFILVHSDSKMSLVEIQQKLKQDGERRWWRIYIMLGDFWNFLDFSY